MFSDAF